MSNFRFSPSPRSSHRGFSLIELLVVATIIIILTTIGVVSYSQTLLSSRNARRKADLEIVRQALILYKADEGHYPSGNYSGLSGASGLGSGYLNSLPTDPKQGQGVTYVYTYVPTCGGAAATTCQDFTLGASLETSGGVTSYSITSP